MAFYKDKEEMFQHRANRFEREGKEHWAKAKNGEGDYHFGKAKKCFEQAKENKEKAQQYKGQGW